jgi:hypothetical protein
MGRSVCIAGMFLIGLFCLAVDAAERQDGDDWPMYGRNLQHTFDNGKPPYKRASPNWKTSFRRATTSSRSQRTSFGTR